MYGIGDFILDGAISIGYGAAVGFSAAAATVSGPVGASGAVTGTIAAAKHIQGVHERLKKEKCDLTKW